MFWQCNESILAEDGHVVLKKGQMEFGQQNVPISKLDYASLLDKTLLLSIGVLAMRW